MTASRFLAACLLCAALTATASAGIFFNRQPKPKPRPEDRVPELIATVRTDPDENKRSAAATELRQYDAKVFKDIVPVLADVLRNDSKAGVRYEAAVSLSRIRPVSTEAGLALDHAAAHDAAFYIRMQARTSLVYYRLSGYRTPRPIEQQTAKKTAPSKTESSFATTGSPPDLRLTPNSDPSSTAVKPIAQTRPIAVHPLPDNMVPRPLPQGPARSPLVPAEPPKLDTPPSSTQEEGPALNPPGY